MTSRDNRLLVAAIAASQFAQVFMISGVAVALPAMGADLNAGAASLGLVETLFLAGSVALLLPVGRLADASDKASLFKLGAISFGVCTLLVPLFSSVPVILFLRFMQGCTSAISAATGAAIVADVVPPQRRGSAYGITIAAVYAGLTLGPVGAGFLIHHWGWRAMFWGGGALVMLAYALIQILLPSRWRPAPPGAVHLPSSALVVAAMLLLAIGCSTVREPALGYGLVAAGLALTVVFLFSQRRLKEPLMNVEVLMRNTVLRNALLVQLLLYTNAFCSVFMLSIYMQVVLEETARTAGQVIALGSLLMAAIAPLAGALADRYRAQVLASFGVALAFVSALLALALDARTTWIQVALLLSVQGVGFAFFSTPNVTIIMNSVPAERRSIASALTAVARTLGMMLGMLMTAAVVSIYIGDAPIGSDPQLFLRTMRTSFVALAAVSLMALAISVAASRPGAPELR